MPKDERRHQKSLQRKAAKRKHRKQPSLGRDVAAAGPPTVLRKAPPAQLRAAATWRLHECLVTRDWEKPGEIVQILVARTSPEGEIGASVFLLDLGCLGVKDAFTRYFPNRREYDLLRDSITGRQRISKVDLDLAARILREGIAYAERLGFKPHRDYYDAALLLEGADPDASTKQIPLGYEGKPFFVAGPYDNVPKIMAQLEKAVGPGNYHFLAPVGPPPGF